MNLSGLIEKRTRIVGDLLLPHLNAGERVLDFGCGTMIIPGYIAKRKEIAFTGVDVIDYPTDDHDFKKMDPDQALPFDDNEFDVTIACFALHHTNDPDFHFRELVRVARKRIILLEDTYNTWIGKIRTRIIDRIYNSNLLVSHLGGSDVNIPYNFKSAKEWKSLIADSNLILSEYKKIYPHSLPHVPAHNILMVIDKPEIKSLSCALHSHSPSGSNPDKNNKPSNLSDILNTSLVRSQA